jgi:hypothetical protein
MRLRLEVTSLLVFLAFCALGADANAYAGQFDFSTSLAEPETAAPVRQAGAHPDLITHLEFPTSHPLNEPFTVFAEANPKDVRVDLPPGMVINPTTVPTCPSKDLVLTSGETLCPATSAVGNAEVIGGTPGQSPIYNLSHGPNVPALLGFYAYNVPIFLEGIVRPGDYGVSSLSVRTSQSDVLEDVNATIWGVPEDPIHDPKRGPNGTSASTPLPPLPFVTTPTSCEGKSLVFTGSTNYWQSDWSPVRKDVAADSQGTPFVFGGCEKLPFAPQVTMRASSMAGSPTGLEFGLAVPQNESPAGLATAHVKRISVLLPQGFAISPSAASGLNSCSESEIGIGTNDPPTCPDSSSIGSVTVKTPLLEEELSGHVYLADQKANPFGSDYAIYLAVKGPGFFVKLPGKIETDPQTGQFTTSFGNQPQLPYENVSFQLDSGPRAPIVTPSNCGTYSAKVEIESWASRTPTISSIPLKVGSGCANGGFSPKLKAGTTNPTGGSFSPFTLQVTRNDGEADLSRIDATLPPGLLAKLAGVPLCGDAQATSGNCPSGSQVGTTTVGVGAGPSPLYVPEAGKAPTAVYLAGPYMGAPYSLVVKVPAQAGPFDLGTVLVRNALKIDPTTTQVTAESDPLPQILEGVPITYRDVRVEITRPEFTLNPSNCSQFQVTSVLTSATGQGASPKAPFAAANCERLGFKPTLALQMTGSTKRAGNPALTATLKAPKGQANIASTTVILPKTVFIDQRHVSGPCTRVQFAANSCPVKSVLGTAKAWSPLLDKPLEGPVYFRSNGGERQLPDIVADLNGQINVVLVGFIDSKKVGKETSLVRTRFASVPDAPVSKFVLKLKGGKRSLIQNSANLCKVRPKAEVKFEGQNGKTNDFAQKIALKCGKAKKSKPNKS